MYINVACVVLCYYFLNWDSVLYNMSSKIAILKLILLNIEVM